MHFIYNCLICPLIMNCVHMLCKSHYSALPTNSKWTMRHLKGWFLTLCLYYLVEWCEWAGRMYCMVIAGNYPFCPWQLVLCQFVWICEIDIKLTRQYLKWMQVLWFTLYSVKGVKYDCTFHQLHFLIGWKLPKNTRFQCGMSFYFSACPLFCNFILSSQIIK
jgi:hypothetical protein